ncbi:hypothetical protein MGYG_00868 [Nannizzia gypsea CBS 118893]|uniref:Uncharacterized protein n=1 Tax=Arthroderma gypseum (strain ATCC MYA-4604 / CBS 118893) TaxID=535722 RepID=E5R2F6_ARTGP|nr:hypothetical protein MGYG_00868 [Nannizzia gypsea CBS 118893]EFQ97832.1 hypothetical protein MGYG_00868 [Nannizzia gypsea CBS 118893]
MYRHRIVVAVAAAVAVTVPDVDFDIGKKREKGGFWFCRGPPPPLWANQTSPLRPQNFNLNLNFNSDIRGFTSFASLNFSFSRSALLAANRKVFIGLRKCRLIPQLSKQHVCVCALFSWIDQHLHPRNLGMMSC